MQNRNFIKIIAVVFAIICVYQLSFTWIADRVESDAAEYAENFNEKCFYIEYRIFGVSKFL